MSWRIIKLRVFTKMRNGDDGDNLKIKGKMLN